MPIRRALVAQGRLVEPVDGNAIHHDIAARRALQPVDGADEGRLAGARAADHAVDLAPGDGDGNVLQRLHRRIAAARGEDLGDIVQDDRGPAARARKRAPSSTWSAAASSGRRRASPGHRKVAEQR